MEGRINFWSFATTRAKWATKRCVVIRESKATILRSHAIFFFTFQVLFAVLSFGTTLSRAERCSNKKRYLFCGTSSMSMRCSLNAAVLLRKCCFTLSLNRKIYLKILLQITCIRCLKDTWMRCRCTEPKQEAFPRLTRNESALLRADIPTLKSN